MAAIAASLWASLFIGILGAAAGGGMSFLAARGQRLRAARVGVYAGPLVYLRTSVANIVGDLGNWSGPSPQLAGLQEGYAQLVRAATVASWLDRSKLKGYAEYWAKVQDVYDEFATESQAPGNDAARQNVLGLEYLERQVREWQSLQAILDGYNAFLEQKLMKRWWEFWI